MLRVSILSLLQGIDNLFNKYDTIVLWTINLLFAVLIATYWYPPLTIVIVPTFGTLSTLWFTIFLSSLSRGR